RPRLPPADATVRLGVPDRRAVVVPDAEPFRVGVLEDREVRLGRAESLAVQHRLLQPPRRFDPARQALGPVDKVVVEEQVRADADLQRLGGRRPRRAFLRPRPAPRYGGARPPPRAGSPTQTPQTSTPF